MHLGQPDVQDGRTWCNDGHSKTGHLLEMVEVNLGSLR